MAASSRERDQNTFVESLTRIKEQDLTRSGLGLKVAPTPYCGGGESCVCERSLGSHMTFYIHARDGAGGITLRRETREAAAKKAEELEQMGYFEVEILEEA